MDESVNVLGQPLGPCSGKPLTGFFRDGHCNTCAADQGSHTVCAVMTDEFLAYSKYVGNDLSTPRPEFRFAGLKAGDRWLIEERTFQVEGVNNGEGYQTAVRCECRSRWPAGCATTCAAPTSWDVGAVRNSSS